MPRSYVFVKILGLLKNVMNHTQIPPLLNIWNENPGFKSKGDRHLSCTSFLIDIKAKKLDEINKNHIPQVRGRF